MKFIISLTLLAFVAFASGGLYEGAKVFRLERIPHETAAKKLNQLIEYEAELGSDNFNIWNGFVAVGSSIDIMVKPAVVNEFEALIEAFGIQSTVIVENVQVLYDAEKASRKGTSRSGNGTLTWDDYHSVDEFYRYYDWLDENYDWVVIESIGSSEHGTDMRVAKLCYPDGVCGKNDALWLDSCIHAREWLAAASLSFVLSELVENYEHHQHMVEKYEWYIMLVSNPDGYTYSMFDEGTRMWRKTRSENAGSLLGCVGTDPNRNWDSMWATVGTSDNPCADTYHGEYAMSEIEVANIAAFVDSHTNIRFSNNIHTYGQMVLLPYGVAAAPPPPNLSELFAVGNRSAETLEVVHGTKFVVDQIYQLVGEAAGGACDYIYNTSKVPCAYGMELRDQGTYGFLAPTTEIIPMGQELFAYHSEVVKILEEGQYCNRT